MTCTGCEATLRLALERVAGVQRAEVSYKNSEAIVEYDPKLTAPGKLRAAIDVAWPSMSKLLGASGKKGKLSFTTDLKEMASKADFIHEASPEREDLKVKLFRARQKLVKAAQRIAPKLSTAFFA